MKVILVCINNFQEYILDCIEQLLLWNNKDIDVICNSEFFTYFSKFEDKIKLISKDSLINDDIRKFYQNSKLDTNFRNGFWTETSSRFFYLYNYIRHNNLENVIHIENDIMVYEDLDNLSKNFKDNMSIIMDSNNRCIPSLIFIKNSTVLDFFIKSYNYGNESDMYTLGKFFNNNRHSNLVNNLPIINDIQFYNNNFEQFKGIFDAAAIGQYLGGVDPRNISGNTQGFVNETCEIKYNNYSFKWRLNSNNLFYPVLINNNQGVKIFNLHIHSKNLKLFSSLKPLNNNFISC